MLRKGPSFLLSSLQCSLYTASTGCPIVCFLGLSHGAPYKFETAPPCLGTFPKGAMNKPDIPLVPHPYSSGSTCELITRDMGPAEKQEPVNTGFFIGLNLGP